MEKVIDWNELEIVCYKDYSVIYFDDEIIDKRNETNAKN